MWDCKYRIYPDHCLRRKTLCFPGGKFCVLGKKYDFPLREEIDPLETQIKSNSELCRLPESSA